MKKITIEDCGSFIIITDPTHIESPKGRAIEKGWLSARIASLGEQEKVIDMIIIEKGYGPRKETIMTAPHEGFEGHGRNAYDTLKVLMQKLSFHFHFLQNAA